MSKNLSLLTFSLILLLVFSWGCQNRKTRAVEGAAIGAVTGAALGSIIGHQSGETGEGAGIGAAIGAIGGAIIGSQIEKEKTPPSAPQYSNSNQLTLNQIIEMTQQGVSPAVIIDRIYLTNSYFKTTPQDIDYLRSQGVSPEVVKVIEQRQYK
ncbi:MAG: glycine zipper 2TM domain-containing protein [Candidatus Omnitrophica bacterium]|nr:glycine zipper 2TM domain-containing protein [Candidatus Omnitrophota bacterium]